MRGGIVLRISRKGEEMQGRLSCRPFFILATATAPQRESAGGDCRRLRSPLVPDLPQSLTRDFVFDRERSPYFVIAGNENQEGLIFCNLSNFLSKKSAVTN